MSQYQIDQINQEYVDYFRDSRHFKRACSESNENELSEDENEDSAELYDKLNRFFITQKLAKCSAANVSKILVANLNSFFVRRFKSLTHRLTVDEDELAEEHINQLVCVIEAVYDHLKTLVDSGSVINYQEFAGFFLSTLKSSCVLFEYLKAFTPNHSDSQQQQQSMTSSQFVESNFNTFQSNLNKKLNAIILKFSGLLESKVSQLQDQTNSLMQLTFYLVKLLSEITEYKSAVYLWKVLTKLIVKEKLFSEINSPDTKSFDNVSYRTVVTNFFLTIYENLYLNLKIVKESIDRLLSGSNDLSISVSFMNSQSTSSRPASLVQDTLKRIKFTGFLIKIYSKFVLTYQQTWLTSSDSYFQLTCIFSALASLLFKGPPVDPNELAESGNASSSASKDFQTVMQECVKELAAFFEQLSVFFGQNYKYHLFLSDGSLLDMITANEFATRTNEGGQKPKVDVLAYYEKAEHFEECLVFLAYFIGRFYTGSDLDKTLSFLSLARQVNGPDSGMGQKVSSLLQSLPFLGVVFRLADVCVRAFNLPTYVTFLELGQKDLQSKLTEIVCASPNQHCIELYEFVLHSLQAYVVNLFLLPDCSETLSLYLINNLITESSPQTKKQQTQFPLKTSFSYDLLLFSGKLNATNNTGFKYLQSLFEVYEFFCGLETRRSHSFVHLEMLLIELVEFQCSQGTQLKALEDYLQDKRLYDSFSLIASRVASKQLEAVLSTALNRLIDFYNEFTVFIETLSKGKQKDQILLKKLSAFIQSKNGLKLADLVYNLFTQQGNESTGPAFKKLPQISNKLVTALFNVEFTEKFFKLLEKSKAMNESLHILFELYLKSLTVWASLKATRKDLDSSDPADTLHVLSFLGKLVQSEFGSHVAALNFKLLMGNVLRVLSSVEIKNASLTKQIVESFCLLLSDDSLIIVNNTLECLNEFLESSQTNNMRLSEIVRSTTITQSVKENIAQYLSQEAFNCGKSAKEILQGRTDATIEREVLKRCHIVDESLEEDIEHNSANSESDSENEPMMDETMNLLCSMDTTISNPSQTATDISQTRKQEQKLLEEFDEQLEQLVLKYSEKERSEWFTEQLTDLWKSKLRSISQ